MATITSLAEIVWAEVSRNIGPFRYSGQTFLVGLTSNDELELGIVKNSSVAFAGLLQNDAWNTVGDLVVLSAAIKSLDAHQPRFASNLLHIATQLSNSDLMYHLFDMASANWVTSQEQAATSGSLQGFEMAASQFCVGIQVLSNDGGINIVGLWGASSVQEIWQGIAYNSDGTWTTNGVIANSVDQLVRDFSFSPGMNASNEWPFNAFVFENNTASTQGIWLYNLILEGSQESSDTLGDTTGNASLRIFGPGFTSPSDEEIHIPYLDADGSISRFHRNYNDPTNTGIQVSITPTGVLGSGAQVEPFVQMQMKGRVDQQRDDAYLVWLHGDGSVRLAWMPLSGGVSADFRGVLNGQLGYDLLVDSAAPRKVSMEVNGESQSHDNPLRIEILYRDAGAALSTGILLVPVPENTPAAGKIGGGGAGSPSSGGQDAFSSAVRRVN